MKALQKIPRTEKRSCQRHTHQAPVRFAQFNEGLWLKAQTVNHCAQGMCVKATVYFQPGTAILLRAEHCSGNSACTHEDLPILTLGEVKWCRQVAATKLSAYEVGVKYYAPYY